MPARQTPTTEAISLLLEDHKNVKKLFREYESAGQSRRATLAEEILSELDAHSKIEEEIFYPAVKAKAARELSDVVAEGYEEHAIVDQLVMELKAMNPGGEQYEAKMKVLMENVEHHIQEEEDEMLKDAKKKLDQEERERLGEQMAKRKAALLRG